MHGSFPCEGAVEKHKSKHIIIVISTDEQNAADLVNRKDSS